MASKAAVLFKGKNRELSEKRRPPLQYVDFKDLLVFTDDDLKKELEKLPDLKLRKDGESVLNRRKSTGNLVSMASQESLFSMTSPIPGVLNRRKRSRSSSILSAAGGCRSNSSLSTRSFFEVSKSVSYNDLPGKYIEEVFQYQSPIPMSMRHLNIRDFVGTDIDWKVSILIGKLIHF